MILRLAIELDLPDVADLTDNVLDGIIDDFQSDVTTGIRIFTDDILRRSWSLEEND